jgi:DNA-binding response OmpR family regulator
VVTRDQLAREVWREPDAGLTNVIDVYVNYVRKKLDKAGESGRIHTVRGQGYCLRD